MTLQTAVIADAVSRYERERDRYLKLAARVADIVRSEIIDSNAIRAQVTSRAKSAKSFLGKLQKFAKRVDKDHIRTVEDVFSRVGDFAGTRVATYRTEDQNLVVDEITKRFCGHDGAGVHVDVKDKLSDGGFYRATHCQVCLRDEELVGTYENLKGTSCEIQVCSMMAHVWNEIEHDIGYKYDGGGPQTAETGLLSALGYLTRSGDEVISRLLEANLARLEEQTGDFEDAFDFVARLRTTFPGIDLSRHAGQLFDELSSLGLVSPESLKREVGEADFEPDVARRKIEEFNSYLAMRGDGDFLLDADSSDLILVLILEKYAEAIEGNHPAGRGKGRPPRIRSIASRYREFASRPGGANAPAS
jgi:ppGpp synthetase/RelA/SpoT-type nucleotidyltranferase